MHKVCTQGTRNRGSAAVSCIEYLDMLGGNGAQEWNRTTDTAIFSWEILGVSYWVERAVLLLR
jgi:hypothetical protein